MKPFTKGRVFVVFDHHGALETHVVDAVSQADLKHQIRALEKQDLVFETFRHAA